MSAGLALLSPFRLPLSPPLVLPWLLWPAAAFLLAWPAMWLSLALAFGRRVPDGAHWTERARLTFPGVKWAAAGPVVVTLLPLLNWRDHFFDGTPAGLLLGTLTGLAAFTASLLAAAHVTGRWRNPASMGDVFRSLAISLLFFAPALLPGLASTLMLGSCAAELPTFVIMIATVAVIVGLLVGGALRLARMIGLVLPPDTRVTQALAEAARRGGKMPRQCGILRWRSANALAFPINQVVLVTRGALDALEDEELVLLCLHEMGHLSESRAVAWARASSAFLFLPLFWCGPLFHRFGFWGVTGALLFLFVGARLYRRLAQRMEIRADAGATSSPASGAAYARMLEKIHACNLIPAVLGPRDSVHPNLYDRMRVAGASPAYPRPLLPPRGRVFRAMLAAVLALSLGAHYLESGIAKLLARADDEAIFESEMK